jgi:hypothetical protein
LKAAQENQKWLMAITGESCFPVVPPNRLTEHIPLAPSLLIHDFALDNLKTQFQSIQNSLE